MELTGLTIRNDSEKIEQIEWTKLKLRVRRAKHSRLSSFFLFLVFSMFRPNFYVSWQVSVEDIRSTRIHGEDIKGNAEKVNEINAVYAVELNADLKSD